MNISFSNVFSALWEFIKKPNLTHLSEAFQENPVKVIGNLLLIDFCLMIPLTALLGIVGIEDMDHKIEDLMDNPLALAGMAVVVAPIMEEAIFRLPMKYSYWRAAIALGLAGVIGATMIPSIPLMGGIAALILFSAFLFHFINYRQENALNVQMESWWERHFYLPFWVLTTAFAIVHISNFGSAVPLYLVPILVLPQFVLGAVIGYVRTGYGFIYAVLFHALHNGILVGLATLGASAGVS